jgi:hypothetical protein
MTAIAAQHDVRAGDGVENHFLNAIFRAAHEAEDPSGRPGRLLSFLYQLARAERTNDWDRLKTLLDGMLRRFIRYISPGL